MKIFVILALVGYAAASPVLLTSGTSSQFRSQDSIGNYAFGYNEDHATGGTFRREQGAPGYQVGSYGLRDADGRHRVVNYVADAAGFRANIQTNEPGVEPKDPAAVLINKAAAIVAPYIAPAVAAAPLVAPAVKAAPLVAPAAYAAPIAAPLAAPVAYAAPISHSSYSVATSHVAPAAPIVSYAAAPLVAPAAYAAPIAAPLAAPLAVAHSAPVAYATKTIASAPIVQSYVSAWK